MQLSFYAKGAQLVTMPGFRPMVSQSPQYVGRRHDRQRRAFPAREEPFRIEADSDAARRLVKLVRRDGSLWPADDATANACGMPAPRLHFADGEWIEDTAPATVTGADNPKKTKGN